MVSSRPAAGIPLGTPFTGQATTIGDDHARRWAAEVEFLGWSEVCSIDIVVTHSRIDAEEA